MEKHSIGNFKKRKKYKLVVGRRNNLSNVSKAIKITKTKGLDISSGVEMPKV